MSQFDKVLNAFKEGAILTAKQISARYGVKNVTALITNIRQSGFAIYANKGKSWDGQPMTRYRIGKPSRKIVAAGYKYLAAQRMAGSAV